MGREKTFTFKCHRKDVQQGGVKIIEASPINAIAFHPSGTFVTVSP